ncbi:MAG TPA: 3-deoxy-7-phosphoheptulonate synthase [Terriglobales bacterium]|nr:3-deoxy-7-phosphoheptulonate synthase [Terriglobales bacterium]
MLIQLRSGAAAPRLESLRTQFQSLGFSLEPVSYFSGTVFSLQTPEEEEPAPAALRQARLLAESVPGLLAVICGPAELASRQLRPEGTRVRIGGVEIGGDEFVVIAGPCSVESREQTLATAHAAAAAGARLLRGGAFKPRTSTYSFQGLGRRGLEILAEAGAAAGLAVVTEVLAPEDVPLVAEYADMLQVGARNMQNFPLLKRVGGQRKPVLLKRGPGATLAEWLAAAEYILARGNDQVVLCERGIRTFETFTRNTLDISAVAAIHELSHLPIFVDPSHATGRRSLVASASRAALAAGADGLCVEVHIAPEESISDREQAISPAEFAAIMADLRPLAAALGRSLGRQHSAPALNPTLVASAGRTARPTSSVV